MEGVRVEGTVRTLIRSTDLADTQDVEGGGIESLYKELLWSERLYDNRLSGSCQVGYWEVPAKG